jgi:hypothetical protein
LLIGRFDLVQHCPRSHILSDLVEFEFLINVVLGAFDDLVLNSMPPRSFRSFRRNDVGPQ